MTSEGAPSAATLSAEHPGVELSQAGDEELGGHSEETVYISELQRAIVVHNTCRDLFEK